jgi:hypothetical protein
MALINIRGQMVQERADTAWVLVGTVERDKIRPNQLTFTRRRDVLSSKISAVGKQILPAVQLTELSGNSVLLTNAKIVDFGPQRGYAPKLGSGHSSHDTSELEEYAFTFTSILVENLSGSTSTSDDWTSNNS